MSKETPIQRIKIGEDYYVLIPFDEYEALRSAAEGLRASFRVPTDAAELAATRPQEQEGETSLRSWRKHRGYTLAQLADKVGSQKSSLSLIETAKRSGDINLWRKLASALGTTIESILPQSNAKE